MYAPGTQKDPKLITLSDARYVSYDVAAFLAICRVLLTFFFFAFYFILIFRYQDIDVKSHFFPVGSPDNFLPKMPQFENNYK